MLRHIVTVLTKTGLRLRGRCRPGAYFGELALLHSGPRAATIMAVTDVSLLALARHDFAALKGPLLVRQLNRREATILLQFSP